MTDSIHGRKIRIVSFNGRKMCVVGMARSGMAAAFVLKSHGAKVTLFDNRPADQLTSQIEIAAQKGIDCVVGVETVPDGTELLITSPGVRKTATVLQDAQARGIEIWSEIEAAYRISAAPIIAVTGTNGKTTTVALLGEIGQAAGIKTFVAGNIAAGDIALPLIRAAHDSKPEDLIIAEISSFQLEWIKEFRPKVAVITNITVDHSDRQTWDEYVAAKWRIFENQHAEDTSVLRSDVPKPVTHLAFGHPPDSREEKEDVPAQNDNPGSATLVSFPTLGKACPEHVEGVSRSDGWAGSTTIYYDQLPRPDWINHLLIPGEHNRENAMAALAAARAFGIDEEIIQRACLAFKGVVHRLEHVLTDESGVNWINNSMCTNNDAFARSLDAIIGPKIVLAGGVYKGGATEQFGQAAANDSVEHLICFGKSGLFLADIAQDHGQVYASVVDTLQDAVKLAKIVAEPGYTVLLSPACASFDQFKDFEDRGDQFKKLVNDLVILSSAKNPE